MGLSKIHRVIEQQGPGPFLAWWKLQPIDRRLQIAVDWNWIGRPEQLIPGEDGAASPRRDWRTWVVKAGRGFGKSRTGSEATSKRVCAGRARSIALVGPTLKKVRQFMIEHPVSGIQAVSPRDAVPEWQASKGELHWPSGAIGYVYTSEEPDDLRGFSGDWAWCDELGSWKYPEHTWSNLQFGLRIAGPRGDRAQAVVTTTPRPIPLLRRLLDSPSTVVTGGTTYENSPNLDADTITELKNVFEGTRLGRQELEAEMLGDTPGALWKLSEIDKHRVAVAPDLRRIVISVDPAVKELAGMSKEDLEELEEAGGLGETGIVATGRGACMCKGTAEDHAFVLGDLSGYFTPGDWAKAVANGYHEHQADRVVAEVNNGGALVRSNLLTLGYSGLSYEAVHAARGKHPRAEPVSALYEQGKVHHVGSHPRLEDELTTWQPMISKKSPNRLDALVWGLTHLMLGPMAASLPDNFPSMPRRV